MKRRVQIPVSPDGGGPGAEEAQPSVGPTPGCAGAPTDHGQDQIPSKDTMEAKLASARDAARNKEALLKAGALQSAIFNSAYFSIIATDEKGVIQIFNVGAERMLGYTAAEVMNKIIPADLH